jgi:dCTP deaminase
LVVLGGVVHAGWSGHILVEMLNKTTHPIRVYANEGIATVLFLGGAPSTGYTGRYQGQGRAQ